MPNPYSPEFVTRALELRASGLDSEAVAEQLQIPRRTLSRWVEVAAKDGRLAKMRSAHQARASAAPPSPEPAPKPAKPTRHASRLDTLHEALARLTLTASNPEEDQRVRVQAEGTIGRLVEIIHRMTPDADLSLLGESMTPEDVTAFVAWMHERRHPRSVEELDAELQRMGDEIRRDNPGAQLEAAMASLAEIPLLSLAFALGRPKHAASLAALEEAMRLHREAQARQREAEQQAAEHREVEQAVAWVAGLERDLLPRG